MNTKRSKQQKKEDAEGLANTRTRISRLFSKWETYRGYLALILTLISVALYLTARTYYGGIDKTVQLKFVENPSVQITDADTSAAQPFQQVLSGEPYETALRLREAGALLMAVSLSAFEDFRTNGKLPATGSQILATVQKRSLLPPGVEIKDGTLCSALSELKLNYRHDPFAFEILSIPVGSQKGPALLFRFPLPSTDANSIMYFQSSSTTQVIPSQLSTPEQLVAAGWSIGHWRGEALPLDDAAVRELYDQDVWLKAANRGGK